ncbi:MAG TPA: NUDIX domain-containing protein [Limnochordia bacterium]
MPRAAALIVERGSVALIERRRGAHHYYLFPGGQIEAGESEAEAAAREVEEELGLQVEIGRLVAVVTYRGNRQYYFLATVVGGTFGTGQGSEMKSPPWSRKGSYTPVWLPLGELLERPVRPRCIAELVARAPRAGWPSAPLHLQDEGPDGAP